MRLLLANKWNSKTKKRDWGGCWQEKGWGCCWQTNGISEPRDWANKGGILEPKKGTGQTRGCCWQTNGIPEPRKGKGWGCCWQTN